MMPTFTNQAKIMERKNNQYVMGSQVVADARRSISSSKYNSVGLNERSFSDVHVKTPGPRFLASNYSTINLANNN